MDAHSPILDIIFAAFAVHAATAFPLFSICLASSSVILNQNLYHSPFTILVFLKAAFFPFRFTIFMRVSFVILFFR